MAEPLAYVIRTVVPEDIQDLVDLGRRTFVDTYGADNDPVNLSSVRRSRRTG